jgi:hypothetical protein
MAEVGISGHELEINVCPLSTPFPEVLLQMRGLCLWLDECSPKLIAFFSTFISLSTARVCLESRLEALEADHPVQEAFTEKGLVL